MQSFLVDVDERRLSTKSIQQKNAHQKRIIQCILHIYKSKLTRVSAECAFCYPTITSSFVMYQHVYWVCINIYRICAFSNSNSNKYIFTKAMVTTVLYNCVLTILYGVFSCPLLAHTDESIRYSTYVERA